MPLGLQPPESSLGLYGARYAAREELHPSWSKESLSGQEKADTPSCNPPTRTNQDGTWSSNGQFDPHRDGSFREGGGWVYLMLCAVL